MIVVVGRVGIPGSPDTVVDTDAVEEVGISRLLALLLVGQAVQTDILTGTRAAGSGKSIGLRRLDRYLTPGRTLERAGTVDGHATLVELLAVAQDILAHLAEIDVEVTAVVAGISLLRGIDKRVEQPELDILDVCRFKVVGIQLTHHTAPLSQRILERSVEIDIGGEVVGAALLRIVSQVQDGQLIGGTVIGGLVTRGVQLADVDRTYIVVRQLVKIAFDMAGRQRRAALGEYRVDVVPREQGTIKAAGHRVLVGIFGKGIRNTGEHPRRRLGHGDGILGILEVVDIRGVILRSAGCSGYELGKLAGKGDLRRLRAMEQRQPVEHLRQPLAFGLPVDVQSPQRVLQGFRAHDHLRCQRLF